MEKHCAKCKTTKNLMPSPYSRRTAKDGTKTGSYMCRNCNAARVKKYRQTTTGAEARYRALLGTMGRSPEKFQARRAVNLALKRGDLVLPNSCSICQQDKPLDAHHPDYSKPLDIIWLCRQCHADIHRTI